MTTYFNLHVHETFSRCSKQKKQFCHWWDIWKGMGSEEKGNHAYKLHPARIKQNVLCSWRKGEGLEFNRGVWFFKGTYACVLHLLTPAWACLFAPVYTCLRFCTCLHLLESACLHLSTHACDFAPAYICLSLLVCTCFAFSLHLFTHPCDFVPACTCLHLLVYTFFAFSLHLFTHACTFLSVCFHMLFVFISDLHLLTPAWTCLFAPVYTCLHFAFSCLPYAVCFFFQIGFHSPFCFIFQCHFAFCILILLLDTFCIPYVSVYFFFILPCFAFFVPFFL